jgi:hypothetical protein
MRKWNMGSMGDMGKEIWEWEWEWGDMRKGNIGMGEIWDENGEHWEGDKMMALGVGWCI